MQSSQHTRPGGGGVGEGGHPYHWSGDRWWVQMEKATAPMMHIANRRANMNRMSQSISLSTLLRLLGGSVAFIITYMPFTPMISTPF